MCSMSFKVDQDRFLYVIFRWASVPERAGADGLHRRRRFNGYKGCVNGYEAVSVTTTVAHPHARI